MESSTQYTPEQQVLIGKIKASKKIHDLLSDLSNVLLVYQEFSAVYEDLKARGTISQKDFLAIQGLITEELPYRVEQYTEGRSTTLFKETLSLLDIQKVKTLSQIRDGAGSVYEVYENAFKSAFDHPEDTTARLKAISQELSQVLEAFESKNALLLIDGELVNYSQLSLHDPETLKRADQLKNVGVESACIRKWVMIAKCVADLYEINNAKVSLIQSFKELIDPDASFEDIKSVLEASRVVSKMDPNADKDLIVDWVQKADELKDTIHGYLDLLSFVD